jgi:hypothetical protein
MSDVDIYRQKADELLRLATAASDMAERSRLITEAARWHMQAVEAEAAGRRGQPREGQDAAAPDADGPEPEAS